MGGVEVRQRPQHDTEDYDANLKAAEGPGDVSQAPGALKSPVPGPEQPHMAEPSPVPPVSTFVVRFWCEWSAAGPRWRGRIEDVQSGESATFLDLEAMLDFVRRCGVMADSEIQTTRKKG